MENRRIQCNHCRQRLTVKTTGTGSRTICPACKLEISETMKTRIVGGDSSSSSPNERSRHSKDCIKEIISKISSHFTQRRSNNSLSVSSGNTPGSSKTLTHIPTLFPLNSISFNSRPNKKAVLCGVTYEQRKYRLKGTINDVKNMRELLIGTFGFPPDEIRMLTEETDQVKPTKKNIQDALHWLVKGCEAGDSLMFYFSGHGLRQPEFEGDEIDGFDETICPLDFLKEGMILDNDINSIIVHPLPKGATLHAIVDACHSGTILDLIYVYDKKKKDWIDHTPKSGARKYTNGGLAISISACEDNELASDTSAFTGKSMNGALTYILIDIAKRCPQITYGELLDQMYKTINDVNKSGNFVERKILKKLFNGIIKQKPQLSSSEKFDVYKRKFLL